MAILDWYKALGVISFKFQLQIACFPCQKLKDYHPTAIHDALPMLMGQTCPASSSQGESALPDRAPSNSNSHSRCCTTFTSAIHQTATGTARFFCMDQKILQLIYPFRKHASVLQIYTAFHKSQHVLPSPRGTVPPTPSGATFGTSSSFQAQFVRKNKTVTSTKKVCHVQQGGPTSNRCIATSNRCIASTNKKLLESLPVNNVSLAPHARLRWAN